MPSGTVSGTVYIWYPDGDHIGHASMYIGDIDVGSKFDIVTANSYLAAIPYGKSSTYRMNDNYVSWWPDDNKEYLSTASEPVLSLEGDEMQEEATAHVKYTLYGLNVAKMRGAWQAIRDKDGAHYKLHVKNCSTIVARVLRAGGALNHAGAASVWFGHSAIWTPKKVAQLCNQMRDKGYATKDKWAHCPAKSDVHAMRRFFGMR